MPSPAWGRSRLASQDLLRLWRGDWGIENRLHYVRDVTMQGRRFPGAERFCSRSDGSPAQCHAGTVAASWDGQHCGGLTEL